MKKTLRITFTLAATVVIILSSGQVKSQDKKEIRKTVIINNGDTLINGKKLSEARPAERKKLLKELEEMEKGSKRVSGTKRHDIIIQRSGDTKVLRWRSENDEMEGLRRVFRFNTDSISVNFSDDSLNKSFSFRMDGLDSNKKRRSITMNSRMEDFPDLIDGSRPGMFIERSEMMNRISSRHENSQSFNYVSTDKDGISSRMNIRISEADAEILKKLDIETKADLEVNDLTIFPNFSTGLMNLSFNLTDKAPAEVKIIDNGFKQLFSEKTGNSNNTYFKQINLPKNGVYYIVINQGSKTFVRKIIKD